MSIGPRREHYPNRLIHKSILKSLQMSIVVLLLMTPYMKGKAEGKGERMPSNLQPAYFHAYENKDTLPDEHVKSTSDPVMSKVQKSFGIIMHSGILTVCFDLSCHHLDLPASGSPALKHN